MSQATFETDKNNAAAKTDVYFFHFLQSMPHFTICLFISYSYVYITVAYLS